MTATAEPLLSHRKGCPCQGCRAIRTMRTKRWRLRQARGVVFWADAAQVRTHVRHLIDTYGMPANIIAKQAGVSRSAVRSLLYGNGRLPPPTRITASNARQLLTTRFDLDIIPDATLINSIGSQRRVQGLAVAGYCNAEVARQLDRHPRNFYRILHSPVIRADLARRIRDLANTLDGTIAPTDTATQRTQFAKARNMANRHSWVPLAAWDDIDDPEATPELPSDDEPDEVLVAEILAGRLCPKLGELREVDLHGVTRALLARGEGASLFAKLFHCNGSRARKLIDTVRMADQVDEPS